MKYMGGKSRIANKLASEFNTVINAYDIKNYYEPFVGGAAVIELVECQNKLGNDLNHYQIALLNHIKQYGAEGFPDRISKDDYEAVKYNKDNYPDWYVGFIGVVGSFNCNWFEGYGGEYSTKDGYYINRAVGFKNQLNNTNEQVKLQDITLTTGDYKDMDITPGSLVYCDPPYSNTSEYKDRGFNHKAFYSWAINIAKNN